MFGGSDLSLDTQYLISYLAIGVFLTVLAILFVPTVFAMVSQSVVERKSVLAWVKGFLLVVGLMVLAYLFSTVN